MELALLIYGINFLTQLNFVTKVVLFFLAITMFAAFVTVRDGEEEKTTFVKKVFKYFCIALVFFVLIPSEKASYLMVGGYVSQKVAQSDTMDNVLGESGNISNKVLTIINQKLDGYIDDTIEKVDNTTPKKG